jgi:hypothetical protein
MTKLTAYYLVKLYNSSQGNAICKTWPVVIILPKNNNAKTNLDIFLPITKKIKGHLFEFRINI